MDGEWSSWLPWATCSATCGAGQQSRYRFCNNPAPQFGGKPCDNGTNLENQNCKLKDCPGKFSLTVFLNKSNVNIIFSFPSSASVVVLALSRGMAAETPCHRQSVLFMMGMHQVWARQALPENWLLYNPIILTKNISSLPKSRTVSQAFCTALA